MKKELIVIIYLDNAATTTVSPTVLEKMLPFFGEQYGNPGALYAKGRDAKAAVLEARQMVADFFHAESPDHIVFTASGSEANNLGLRGADGILCDNNHQHIIVSAVEHSSVIRTADYMNTELWFDLSWASPNEDGVITLDEIRRLARPDTGMVAVMMANNETGAVNHIREIGEFCEKKGILFHVDCVQAAGQIPLDVREMHCTSASVSAHKIHGPKGIGAVYLKHPESYIPLIHGGSAQEFGLRGGTENVPGIIGLGAAIREIDTTDAAMVSQMKRRFYSRLMGVLGEAPRYNGASPYEPGKVLSLTFPGIDAQTLVLLLDACGVCVSAGSACTSQENTPSHVLKAMGLSDEDARSTIRISFSKYNTTEEVLQAAEAVANCISMAKQM